MLHQEVIIKIWNYVNIGVALRRSPLMKKESRTMYGNVAAVEPRKYEGGIKYGSNYIFFFHSKIIPRFCSITSKVFREIIVPAINCERILCVRGVSHKS